MGSGRIFLSRFDTQLFISTLLHMAFGQHPICVNYSEVSPNVLSIPELFPFLSLPDKENLGYAMLDSQVMEMRFC